VNIIAKGMNIDLGTATWRRSTRSGPYTDNCVEVAFVDGAIAVRDSKNIEGPVLIFTLANSTSRIITL
jgi:hypothetical protein